MQTSQLLSYSTDTDAQYSYTIPFCQLDCCSHLKSRKTCKLSETRWNHS